MKNKTKGIILLFVLLFILLFTASTIHTPKDYLFNAMMSALVILGLFLFSWVYVLAITWILSD